MTYPMLIPEPPIQVLPALAELVGFNEAAALQEIHYWLQERIITKFKKGRDWIPNVGDQLHQRFFFWNREDIDYMIAGLEQSEILITLAPSPKDFKADGQRITYHTINYEVLNGQESPPPPIKLVPVAPLIQDILPATNKNTPPSFTAQIHQEGDNVYTLEAHDITHFLACSLILEIQERKIDPEEHQGKPMQEAADLGQVICHFPKIEDEKFKKFVYDDDTLYGILMMRFHMKMMEHLLLFCATHYAVQLIIFADDTQADELKIYHDFLIHQDQTLTPQGEKTEMIFPADQKAFDRWIDFMEETMNKFRQILWREQRTNPAIQLYLKSQQLPEI